MKTYGYIRVSTDKQDEENQRHEILKSVVVDDWISVECSSRKTQNERGITGLFEKLEYGDTVVITEFSRLARSTPELLLMVDKFINLGIGLKALKQGLNIPANGEKLEPAAKILVTIFGMMAEFERDSISMRTKMALSAKKTAGVVLGKPRGTIQPSILDGRLTELKTLLSERKSLSSISQLFGCSRTALTHYVKSRGLLPKNI